jgi:signal transduction histidine kinase
MTNVEKTRLLIVDDEPAHAQALHDTLQDHGFDPVVCTSGETALTALRGESFDLLLSDLMMPGIDGIELLRAALKIDPMLVGIIMTGAGTIPTAVDAMQSGALDYILKPFRLGVILPVLARAVAMRKLRLDNATLQRQVTEHIAELERTNAELDAFTRSASHDLRTPLIAVVGLAELISMSYAEQMPAKAREWLAEIAKSGRKMNRLIDDLLRLSRLGRQALVLTLLDMTALVQACATELRQTQPAGSPEVIIDALPSVRGDASLLRQVLVNLLSNAFKFTSRKAQPLVHVGVSQQGADTAFFVRDNGSGFDMAKAGRLFGAFERLHSDSEFAGTGVGLSIVQQIVQRHGGRIWAEGKVDEGATFYFTLAAKDEFRTPHRPAALGRVEPNEGHQRSVRS